MGKISLSIDIGGTKIAVCLIDNDFTVIKHTVYPTREFSIGSLDFVEEIKSMIRTNLEEGVEKLGVSINCVVHKGVVVHSSLLGGRVNYPLANEFSHQFQLPVQVENDVNSMAIAESKFGQGKNAQSLVLINIGTGLRVSFVYNGQLIAGFSGNTGEISQNRVSIPEFPAKIFLLDNLVSGRGIASIYYELSGINIDAKDVFECVMQRKEDRFAEETIKIFSRELANLLSEVSYFYNPKKIVLNGSVTGSAAIFLPGVIRTYHENTMDIFRGEVLVSDLQYAACLGVA